MTGNDRYGEFVCINNIFQKEFFLVFGSLLTRIREFSREERVGANTILFPRLILYITMFELCYIYDRYINFKIKLSQIILSIINLTITLQITLIINKFTEDDVTRAVAKSVLWYMPHTFWIFLRNFVYSLFFK